VLLIAVEKPVLDPILESATSIHPDLSYLRNTKSSFGIVGLPRFSAQKSIRIQYGMKNSF
jgi:hypothetical protein